MNKQWLQYLGLGGIGLFVLLVSGFLISKMFHKVDFGLASARAQTSPPPVAAPAAPTANTVPDASQLEEPSADLPPELQGESTTTATVPESLGLLEGIIEDYDYQGQDKRDPFAPYTTAPAAPTGPALGPVTELERFDLDQLRLVGIIWNVPRPKALLLDPSQKTYMVYNKTRVGRNNGYVAEIREGELVVIESFENEGRVSFQPRILKLHRE